jgi:hypothetical protein
MKAYTCNKWLTELEAELQLTPQGLHNPMDKLTVSYIFSLESDNTAEFFTEFLGEGKDDRGNTVSYCLSSTPLNEIKHLPIELVPQFSIGKFKQPALNVELGMSLINFLSAILMEISFHGSPSMRKAWWDKLEGAVRRHLTQQELPFEKDKKDTQLSPEPTT